MCKCTSLISLLFILFEVSEYQLLQSTSYSQQVFFLYWFYFLCHFFIYFCIMDFCDVSTVSSSLSSSLRRSESLTFTVYKQNIQKMFRLVGCDKASFISQIFQSNESILPGISYFKIVLSYSFYLALFYECIVG